MIYIPYSYEVILCNSIACHSGLILNKIFYMTVLIKYFLLSYFLLFFGVIFVGISLKTARIIGKSPVVLPGDDSAYALIGRYFKWTLLGIFLYVCGYFFYPDLPLFTPFRVWISIKVIGITAMLMAFVWILTAQLQMKDAWRIGIDTAVNTGLVTSGLFTVSRNPVFFGMLVILVGLVLVTPNIFSLVFLILGSCFIRLQVYLEEDFLLRQHGNAYIQYKQNTRRFI